MTVLSNDIKKGMQLTANGFRGEMFDNKRGNIRTIKVDGIMGQEIGSCYVWDISSVTIDGMNHRVELTPKQKQARIKIKAMGF